MGGTKRENLLRLFRRRGYNEVPVFFELSPFLEERFKDELGIVDYWSHFDFPWRYVEGPRLESPTEIFASYYGNSLKPGTEIDAWGVAHEKGSEAAMHMTRLRYPLAGSDDLSFFEEYPFPDFSRADTGHMAEQASKNKESGYASLGRMGQTIWERSWSIRSMEELMMDMMLDDPKASLVLDRVTEGSIQRAVAYAQAPVDILWIGDDIGMQSSIMMSEELYRKWLKPRIKQVIDAAKKVKPDILVLYHSCGFIRPFIPDLIEVGVDILNPVQPESMDFAEIHTEFGRDLSFHGTIGTQSTMPFGSPKDVRDMVIRNLDIAGDRGGLFCTPTHLLEPEVPVENILAYAEACSEYNS